MSIYYSGTIKRSCGIASAINKQIKLINLKGVKRIQITFDPFAENITSTREFLFWMQIPKIIETNPKCTVRTNIVCNRQPAAIDFSLIESARDIAKASTIRFLSKNLNTLELLQLCNKYVTPLAPEDTIALASSNKAEQQKSKKQQTKRK